MILANLEEELLTFSRELKGKLSLLKMRLEGIVNDEIDKEPAIRHELQSGGYLTIWKEGEYKNPFTHQSSPFQGIVLIVPDAGVVLISFLKDIYSFTHRSSPSHFAHWEFARESESFSLSEIGSSKVERNLSHTALITRQLVWDRKRALYRVQSALAVSVWLVQQSNLCAEDHDITEYLRSVPYVVGAEIEEARPQEYPSTGRAEVVRLYREGEKRFTSEGIGSQPLSPHFLKMFLGRSGIPESQAEQISRNLRENSDISLEEGASWVEDMYQKALRFLQNHVEIKRPEGYTTGTNL